MSEITHPILEYYRSLIMHKNFIISLLRQYFFGRYKNAYLGFTWNFLSPMIYILLLYIASTEIKGRDPEFLIMIVSGVSIYHLLVSGITGGCGYFISGASMIKKMFFPREILVYSQLIVKLFVALIIYTLLFIFIIVTGHGFNFVALLWFPIIVILSFLFAIGCSLILSSITVYVRDIQYAAGSISLIFFIMTPLRDSIYNISGLRGELMWYNPFTYFIEPMHQILYYNECPELYMIGYAAIFTLIALITGALVFNLLKPGFVERL